MHLLFMMLIPLQTPFDSGLLLKPEFVFDGVTKNLHTGWGVLISGERIKACGPLAEMKITDSTRHLELKGLTLMPGLIDCHTHLLLHAYNETSWEDQVLREPLSLRVCRATNHARDTLLAGFTTIRDLGTEGAGYADVGIKQAIQQGIIPGPRMQVTTRAIVATGTYAPRGFAQEWSIPQGAEEADAQNLIKVVRDQISKGADWIKVYADYRAGIDGETRPTFSVAELKLIVETADSLGRKVCAHATSKEGMTRAAQAGVATVEHGTDGDEVVFRLMASKGVALVPTLAASEAIYQYRHRTWKPDEDPEPDALRKQRSSFKSALDAGVSILCGSDAGVFPHGKQARELELMVKYGMPNGEVLKSATSITAKALGLEGKVGCIQSGQFADLIAIDGNPLIDIKVLRKVRLVIKQGTIVKQP